MADIRCRTCGEPWDADTIHEEVAERTYLGEKATYGQVAAEFAKQGCKAFREFLGSSVADCTPRRNLATEATGALTDLGLTSDEAENFLEDMGVLA